MKHALISPFEPRESGFRVAEVTGEMFEVAEPLFWVECDDSIVADQFWYNPASSQFTRISAAAPDAVTEQPTVDGAQTL